MPGFSVLPGGQVTASIKGSYYLNTLANFRSELQNYIVQQGFRVVSLEITTGWNPVEVEYVATITVAPQASITTDRIVDALRSAGERAGGATPTVTITSAGESAQAPPASNAIGNLASTVLNAVSNVASGVGNAASGLGGIPKAASELPKDIKQLTTIIVIGLVVIIGLVAFGPNVKQIARSAR